jgi:hypothetical protein
LAAATAPVDLPESAFTLEEDLERKYRDKERSYVVRTGTKQ